MRSWQLLPSCTSLKGEFLHFHCHFSTLNNGYFCLTENYNGRFCDFISIIEEEIEMQHLRQMIFPNAHNEDYKVLPRLIQKMLKRNSVCFQCNFNATGIKGNTLWKKANFKKRHSLSTFTPFFSFQLFHKICSFYLDTVTSYLIVCDLKCASPKKTHLKSDFVIWLS